MNKHAKSLLLSLVVVCFSVSAQAREYSLDFSAGYRADSLDWNIAADFFGSTPNILSELTWKDLQSFQVAVDAEIYHPLRQGVDTVLLGRAAYGWIVSGKNQDSDYSGDNRTLEWSRSNNDAGDGHVFDLEGGVGVRYRLQDEKWSLMPNIGYAYYEQDLAMREGYQTVSEPILAPPPFIPIGLGPFPGLNSSYFAWWFGPWLGLQADYQHSDDLQFDLSLRWHKIDLRAEANWNLIARFAHPISFEHEADGDGFSVQTGVDYRLREDWSLLFDFRFIDLQGDDGLDIVYFSDGSIGGTRLNEVNWGSWSLSFGARYQF